MAKAKRGMRRGLTAYGDEDFSLFLRTAFIKAMGTAANDCPTAGPGGSVAWRPCR